MVECSDEIYTFYSNRYGVYCKANFPSISEIDNHKIDRVKISDLADKKFVYPVVRVSFFGGHYVEFNTNTHDIIDDLQNDELNGLSDFQLSVFPRDQSVVLNEKGVDTNLPVKSDGGSSGYYDIKIPDWLLNILIDRSKEGNCFVKTEELIEVAFGNDFNFGTLFKSTVRAYGCSVGAGKAGNDMTYEVNKVKYYSDKIHQRYSRNKKGA